MLFDVSWCYLMWFDVIWCIFIDIYDHIWSFIEICQSVHMFCCRIYQPRSPGNFNGIARLDDWKPIIGRGPWDVQILDAWDLGRFFGCRGHRQLKIWRRSGDSLYLWFIMIQRLRYMNIHLNLSFYLFIGAIGFWPMATCLVFFLVHVENSESSVLPCIAQVSFSAAVRTLEKRQRLCMYRWYSFLLSGCSTSESCFQVQIWHVQ